MHKKITLETTFSDDVAAGELVKFEFALDGKRTGRFVTTRVVTNNDEMVQFDPFDVPRATLERNWDAMSAVLEGANASRISPVEI